MKKVKSRTLSVIIFVAAIMVGLVYFMCLLISRGESWVTFPTNKNVYSGGVLALGTVYDKNGVLLVDCSSDGITYADSETVRKANLHVTGDAYNSIGTGALKAFSDKLIGYNLLNGTYSFNGKGKDLYLTIESDLNVAAYNALNGRKGTVAIYNYKTGEIICNVSTPTYDPANKPEISDSDSSYEGVYLNRFLSSTYTPGSVFKVVTTAAAIDTFSDAYDRQYTCNGSCTVIGNVVNCTGNHGTIGLEQAMAVSCNVYFAELTLDLGGKTLSKYADQLGITSSISIDGISTAAGSYSPGEDESAELAWSGIGQHDDLVNPASMLTLMGAIANGGEPIMPRYISKVSGSLGLSLSTTNGDRMLSEETASTLKNMLRNNVVSNYGQGTFPGLTICAKTGTAEVGSGKPHSWFVGFLDDSDNPLAFVVVVENGGSGLSAAGSIANTVLQAAVS